MAGYGYRTYSGMEPRINDEGWRKPSFDDHVCRPVIIDAEGRKQPIIRYNGSTTPTSHNTPGSNVAKTETYVEHVHSPMDYTINYSSSPSMVVSPPEDRYEFNKQQGQSLLSRVHNPPQKVKEFIHNAQTEVHNKPTPSHFSTAFRRSTGYSTTTGYGDYNNNGGYRERDEPNRAGYWSTPPSEGRERTSTTKIQLTKPTNEISTAIEYLKEAATIAKPFLGSNGTGTDAVAPPTITRRPRFTIGVPPPRRSDNATTNSGSTTTTTTVETISSSEAKRRYGNAPSLSFTTGEIENYAATIDSREAMKRYNGRIV